MSEGEGLRLDHYLFRARLFKSRSKATGACREGRVMVNDSAAKSASTVRTGDLVKIRDRGLYRHIRILELPGRNMSKDEAKTTWSDETPDEVIEQKKQLALANRIWRGREGGAKPNKKERRELRELKKRGGI